MNTKEILQGIKNWTGDKLDTKVDKTTKVNGHALSSNVTVSKSDVGLENVTNDAQVKRSEMGAASGVATLDSAGKVPSSQLPSYVDDVLEYDTKSAFPATGEAGKIYVDKSNNTTWRWSGTAYTQIKGDLAIGTTSGTAADGKVVNDHINNTSNPHGVTKSQVGLGSVVNTGDSATPVSGGTTKFTTGGAYTELNKKVDKVSGKGLSTNDYTTDEKNKLGGIASGAEVNQNAFSNVGVKVGNTTTTVAADAKTDTVTLIQGSNVTLTADTTNDTITIAAKDTTYSSKAAASGGSDVSLVTTGEKYTWNNKSNFSGSYNDLTNKPTIPDMTNVAYLEDASQTATVAGFDPQADTVHVTAQSLTAAQKAQARTNIDAIGSSALNGYATQTWVQSQGYESKVAIESASGSTLSAQLGKYYRFDSAVTSLAVTLPTISNATTIQGCVFYLTTSSSISLTFTGGGTVKYHDGYEIKASSTYEINAIWNGAVWVIASIKIA